MNGRFTVLVIEDDHNLRLGCVQAIQLAGMEALGFDKAEDALRLLKSGFEGIVVTDLKLPGMDGLSVVKRCAELDRDLPVIVVTGHGDIAVAVEAMRSGAYEFMTKPFGSDRLIDVVQRAREKRMLTLEVSDLRQRLARLDGVEGKLIGKSAQIRKVRSVIADIADANVDVLLLGETGVGKELVARALHRHSRRRNASLVSVSCTGIADELLESELFGHEAGAFPGTSQRRIGKAEHATRGTLFLDEIDAIQPNVQIKLFRLLHDRTIERVGSNRSISVECRVVAAAGTNLSERVQSGAFRSDLYYRLSAVTIELPPLRERREDIPILLEHFMLHAAGRFRKPHPSVTTEQMNRLMAYSWPGNVRELETVADCLVLGIAWHGLSDPALAGQASPQSLAEWVGDFERNLIASELQRFGGSLAQTARALKVPKATLHDKIRKYKISE
ncbi:sigma-54 dependent transcriptional regulator [Rhizobium sp. 1AS11]|uniref:sigma-54-dependent transcriptional regulator n=1 Tax=Rhizobium acaciae TaxID=2989736 RepID=UPI00221EBB0E|nr:sigma-54 dependent transcriptional regulator [Rhizobium acaciae]MCW1408292.1 sigma-54 dependent transcriptional regulator [Rhizobium acaciae]MCW1740443.1 sigma-54 dependent transcriptional regulator [Rhizobium acaciae]MCW1751522.1 sigma-54 dependent transcriptional regulator [Rhizobium acaciae]